MESLLLCSGIHTQKASQVKDRKRLAQADLRATEKEKKHRQGQNFLRVRREEALRDAEDLTYGAAALYY